MSNSNNTPAYVVFAAESLVIADEAKAKYSSGNGNGNDAFNYRRGSGASGLSFVFALNLAFNEGKAQTREALTNAMLAACELKLWPGKARDGIAPALASMHNRGFAEHVSGAWRLTASGESRARLMFADMGLSWPEAETAEAPAPKAKKSRKAKAKKVEQPAEAPEVVNDDTANDQPAFEIVNDENANDQPAQF